MPLESLTLLFELAFAIGVIVSLVYLAVQIRQNTGAIRRAAAREIVRDLNDHGRFLIESPHLVQVHLRAN